MVVTISNPRLEGQNLTYDVETLEGDLPKTGPMGLMLRAELRGCPSSEPYPSRDVWRHAREDDQPDGAQTLTCIADGSKCASRARQPLYPYAVRATVHGLPSPKLIMRPSEARPTLQ